MVDHIETPEAGTFSGDAFRPQQLVNELVSPLESSRQDSERTSQPDSPGSQRELCYGTAPAAQTADGTILRNQFANEPAENVIDIFRRAESDRSTTMYTGDGQTVRRLRDLPSFQLAQGTDLFLPDLREMGLTEDLGSLVEPGRPRLANQTADRPVTPPTNQPADRSLTPPANQPGVRAVTPATNQPGDRPVTLPTSQPAVRSLTPPATNQPGERSATPPTGTDRVTPGSGENRPDAPLPDPDNVTRGADGKIERIVYPDGRVRTFIHDSRGLSQVTETDTHGTRAYVNNSGNWSLRAGSIELPLAGEFDLRENGAFALRNATNQPWQIENPDGTRTIERPRIQTVRVDTGGDTSAPRATVELQRDRHGNIDQVRLPNGSTRAYRYDESGRELLQITDTVKTPQGDRVEQWTRQAQPTGGMSSDFVRTQPASTDAERRTGVRVTETGSYEYSDARAERKVSQLAITGDASSQTPWRSNVNRDDQGRFRSIENDRFRRDYEYFEGTNKIRSYTVVDKRTGEGATWTRANADSDMWTSRSRNGYQTSGMRGEFSVTDDGLHLVRKQGESPYVFLPDGTRCEVTVGQDGNVSARAEGRVRYVRRTDGGTVAYTKADGSEISVYDHQNRTRVTWSRGTDGNWTSDSAYEPGSRRDMTFNDKGELSYKDSSGATRTRTLDGQEIVQKEDGSKLVYDRQGNLTKVIFGDTERTFVRDGNQITGITETTRGERRSVFPPPLARGQRMEDVQLSRDGDLSYIIRGTDQNVHSAVTERSNGLRVEYDDSGFLKSVRRPNGMTRAFEYAGEGVNKTLIQVRDARPSPTGERVTTWSRNALPNGGYSPEFQSRTDQGRDRPARTIGNILPDGSYEFTTADQRPGDRPRVQRLTGGDGGGEAFASDNVEDAHFNLMDTMRQHMDEPRLQRMEEMMRAYEQRMQQRAVARRLAGVTSPETIDQDVAQTVSRTYDQLSQLVSGQDPRALFDQNQRVFLAENFMFHAQDPTTMDQGPSSPGDSSGHGTCWIQAAHIWALTQRTDHMADLLRQVALTGRYTTKNGGEQGSGPKTVEFSREYLRFPDGFQETRWCISKATDMWDRRGNMMSQCDGERSPVGKIFDYVLPVLGGRRQTPAAMDGGTYDSFNQPGNRWYVGNAEIMQMVTGDRPCDVARPQYSAGHLVNNDIRRTLLEKGTVLNYLPGHLRSLHLRQMDGQWVLYQDDQHGESDDRIVGRITDLERWARGDNSACRTVNERVNHRRFRLETDYTIRGTIQPSPDSNNWNNTPSRHQQTVPDFAPRPGYSPQPGGWNPQPGGWNPQPGGWNPQPGGWIPQPDPRSRPEEERPRPDNRPRRLIRRRFSSGWN